MAIITYRWHLQNPCCSWPRSVRGPEMPPGCYFIWYDHQPRATLWQGRHVASGIRHSLLRHITRRNPRVQVEGMTVDTVNHYVLPLTRHILEKRTVPHSPLPLRGKNQ